MFQGIIDQIDLNSSPTEFLEEIIFKLSLISLSIVVKVSEGIDQLCFSWKIKKIFIQLFFLIFLFKSTFPAILLVEQWSKSPRLG